MERAEPSSLHCFQLICVRDSSAHCYARSPFEVSYCKNNIEYLNESIGTLLVRLVVQSLTMVQHWYMHRQARVKLYSGRKLELRLDLQ